MCLLQSLRMPCDMRLCRSSSKCPTPAIALETAAKSTQGAESIAALRLPHATTLERPKVVRTCGVLRFLTMLTWKRASRHNSVHLLNISTSKRAPRMVCFDVFILTWKFAWRHNGDISTCKSAPRLKHFHILTWKCASCHNGVHFLNISTSKNGLRPRCFEHFDFKIGSVQFSSRICTDGSAPAALASPLFDPPEPQNIGKKLASRLFHIFAHFDLLSTDSFSLDSFSSPTPLTTVAALAHKSEVWFLTSFDYVVYWPNSIYIVANWDDDHNSRGVEPSKLWYRWPMFSWNNKKEPGEKKTGLSENH